DNIAPGTFGTQHDTFSQYVDIGTIHRIPGSDVLKCWTTLPVGGFVARSTIGIRNQYFPFVQLGCGWHHIDVARQPFYRRLRWFRPALSLDTIGTGHTTQDQTGNCKKDKLSEKSAHHHVVSAKLPKYKVFF